MEIYWGIIVISSRTTTQIRRKCVQFHLFLFLFRSRFDTFAPFDTRKKGRRMKMRKKEAKMERKRKNEIQRWTIFMTSSRIKSTRTFTRRCYPREYAMLTVFTHKSTHEVARILMEFLFSKKFFCWWKFDFCTNFAFLRLCARFARGKLIFGKL